MKAVVLLGLGESNVLNLICCTARSWCSAVGLLEASMIKHHQAMNLAKQWGCQNNGSAIKLDCCTCLRSKLDWMVVADAEYYWRTWLTVTWGRTGPCSASSGVGTVCHESRECNVNLDWGKRYMLLSNRLTLYYSIAHIDERSKSYLVWKYLLNSEMGRFWYVLAANNFQNAENNCFYTKSGPSPIECCSAVLLSPDPS